jgi:hypothetical protein
MKISTKTSVVFSLVVSFLLITTGIATALTNTVNLHTAASFAVLAGAGITNTGTTTITGDVGSFATLSQSGFGTVTLNGTNHAGDSVTQGAKTDLVTAYNDAFGRTPVTTIATELGGHTYTSGIYNSNSGEFGITGTLTLDAQNNPNAVFIFKAGSTLVTASDNSVVLLINQAQPCNVFWQVTSSATLGTHSTFVGNILALESITVNTGATVNGRILARNGAVTMDGNNITVDICQVAGTPTPTVTPTPRQLSNTNGGPNDSWGVVIVALAAVSTISVVVSVVRRKQTKV